MASDAAKTTAQGDEQFFDAAFQELNSGNRVQGLWAKCFAEADGDDMKARAAYIRVRAARLQSVYEAERVEKAETESLAAIEVKIEEQEFGAPSKWGEQNGVCPNCKALMPLCAMSITRTQ